MIIFLLCLAWTYLTCVYAFILFALIFGGKVEITKAGSVALMLSIAYIAAHCLGAFK